MLQEVFRRLAGGIGKFERGDGGSFRGWLWRISRNAANDYFTHRRDTPQAAGGTAEHLALQQVAEPSETEAEVRDDRVRLLHAALAAIRGDFQPHTWQIFWRTAIEGEDTAALAQELGLTLRAVRQARHRVLQRLREQFAGLVD